MSIENVKKFYDLAAKDERLRKNIYDVDSKIGKDGIKKEELSDFIENKIIPIAKSYNLEFTVNELMYFVNDKLKKFTDEQLDAISGGISPRNAALTLSSVLLLSVGATAALNLVSGPERSSPSQSISNFNSKEDNNSPDNFNRQPSRKDNGKTINNGVQQGQRGHSQISNNRGNRPNRPVRSDLDNNQGKVTNTFRSNMGSVGRSSGISNLPIDNRNDREGSTLRRNSFNSTKGHNLAGIGSLQDDKLNQDRNGLGITGGRGDVPNAPRNDRESSTSRGNLLRSTRRFDFAGTGNLQGDKLNQDRNRLEIMEKRGDTPNASRNDRIDRNNVDQQNKYIVRETIESINLRIEALKSLEDKGNQSQDIKIKRLCESIIAKLNQQILQNLTDLNNLNSTIANNHDLSNNENRERMRQLTEDIKNKNQLRTKLNKILKGEEAGDDINWESLAKEYGVTQAETGGQEEANRQEEINNLIRMRETLNAMSNDQAVSPERVRDVLDRIKGIPQLTEEQVKEALDILKGALQEKEQKKQEEEKRLEEKRRALEEKKRLENESIEEQRKALVERLKQREQKRAQRKQEEEKRQEENRLEEQKRLEEYQATLDMLVSEGSKNAIKLLDKELETDLLTNGETIPTIADARISSIANESIANININIDINEEDKKTVLSRIESKLREEVRKRAGKGRQKIKEKGMENLEKESLKEKIRKAIEGKGNRSTIDVIKELEKDTANGESNEELLNEYKKAYPKLEELFKEDFRTSITEENGKMCEASKIFKRLEEHIKGMEEIGEQKNDTLKRISNVFDALSGTTMGPRDYNSALAKLTGKFRKLMEHDNKTEETGKESKLDQLKENDEIRRRIFYMKLIGLPKDSVKYRLDVLKKYLFGDNNKNKDENKKFVEEALRISKELVDEVYADGMEDSGDKGRDNDNTNNKQEQTENGMEKEDTGENLRKIIEKRIKEKKIRSAIDLIKELENSDKSGESKTELLNKYKRAYPELEKIFENEFTDSIFYRSGKLMDYKEVTEEINSHIEQMKKIGEPNEKTLERISNVFNSLNDSDKERLLSKFGKAAKKEMKEDEKLKKHIYFMKLMGIPKADVEEQLGKVLDDLMDDDLLKEKENRLKSISGIVNEVYGDETEENGNKNDANDQTDNEQEQTKDDAEGQSEGANRELVIKAIKEELEKGTNPIDMVKSLEKRLDWQNNKETLTALKLISPGLEQAFEEEARRCIFNYFGDFYSYKDISENLTKHIQQMEEIGESRKDILERIRKVVETSKKEANEAHKEISTEGVGQGFWAIVKDLMRTTGNVLKGTDELQENDELKKHISFMRCLGVSKDEVQNHLYDVVEWSTFSEQANKEMAKAAAKETINKIVNEVYGDETEENGNKNDANDQTDNKQEQTKDDAEGQSEGASTELVIKAIKEELEKGKNPVDIVKAIEGKMDKQDNEAILKALKTISPELEQAFEKEAHKCIFLSDGTFCSYGIIAEDLTKHIQQMGEIGESNEETLERIRRVVKTELEKKDKKAQDDAIESLKRGLWLPASNIMRTKDNNARTLKTPKELQESNELKKHILFMRCLGVSNELVQERFYNIIRNSSSYSGGLEEVKAQEEAQKAIDKIIDEVYRGQHDSTIEFSKDEE